MDVAVGAPHSAAELCWSGDGRGEPRPQWSAVLGSGVVLTLLNQALVALSGSALSM